LITLAPDVYKNNPEWRQPAPNGPSIEAAIHLTPADGVHVNTKKGRIRIIDALVSGDIQLVLVHHKPVFKVWRKFGEETAIAGCAIALFANENLMGASVNNLDGRLSPAFPRRGKWEKARSDALRRRLFPGFMRHSRESLWRASCGDRT
jgi:hypothetical protein